MSVIVSKKIMGVLTHLWQEGFFSISGAAEPPGELTVWGVGLVDRVIGEQPHKKQQNQTEKNTGKHNLFESWVGFSPSHSLFMTDTLPTISGYS